MKLAESKGLSNLPVYFAIAVLALLVAGTAVGQLFKLPPAFGNTVDEAGVITEAETRLDDTLHHFLPLAAHYGVSEAAYQVGSNNTNYTGVDNDDTSEMDVYAPMIDKVDNESQSYFEQYSNQLQFDRCDVDTDDQAVLNIAYESRKVNITPDSSNSLVTVECSSPEADISTATKTGKETSYNISNVRFHEFASLTVDALEELERVSEDLESNNNLDGSVTKSTTCSYGENSNGGEGAAKDAAKSVAYQAALPEAVNKIEQIEKALVEGDHGIGSGSNRGAKHALWEGTNSDHFCFLGWCPANLVYDDIDYRAYVVDNETSFSSTSNSTSKCGCNNKVCNQDPDGEYTYNGDACENAGEESYSYVTDTFSNSYSADCDPGEHKDGGDCYNASSSPRHIVGSPTCDEEDFSHDGSGNCEVDEEDGYASGRPSAQCENKVFKAESTVDWEYQRTEIQLNLTDDKFEVPTSVGWINLFMNRKYVRDYNP